MVTPKYGKLSIFYFHIHQIHYKDPIAATFTLTINKQPLVHNPDDKYHSVDKVQDRSKNGPLYGSLIIMICSEFPTRQSKHLL